MSEAGLTAGEDGAFMVHGELVFATAAHLHAESAGIVRDAPAGRPLVFDLTEVSRVDSAGVALVLAWLRGTRERGIELRLRNVPAQLRSIAEVSDLDALLPLENGTVEGLRTGQDGG